MPPNTLEPGYVLPNQKVPKILGVFNILIGSVLLLLELASLALILLFPGLLGTQSSAGFRSDVRAGTFVIGAKRPTEAPATTITAKKVVTWTGSILAIVLDVGLIVSGVGLFVLSARARRLAMWVAGLQLACLVVFSAIWIFWLIPADARMAQGSMEDVRIEAMVDTVVTAGTLVIGSIYPILSLILLSRLSVWAACEAAGRASREVPLKKPSA